MSGSEKLLFDVVYPAACRLRDTLAPACERLEFAGSLRRAGGEASVLLGDIELCAIPKPIKLAFGVPAERQVNALETLLLDMVDRNVIRRWPVELARPAWGPKYKKFWVPVSGQWFQVDLFLADPANWGSVLAIRTGPEAFSKALVTHILINTQYRQQDGYLCVQATGEIVPTPAEEDYFAAAGVQYVPPERRISEDDVMPIRRDGRVMTAARRDAQRQMRLF